MTLSLYRRVPSTRLGHRRMWRKEGESDPQGYLCSSPGFEPGAVALRLALPDGGRPGTRTQRCGFADRRRHLLARLSGGARSAPSAKRGTAVGIGTSRDCCSGARTASAPNTDSEAGVAYGDRTHLAGVRDQRPHQKSNATEGWRPVRGSSPPLWLEGPRTSPEVERVIGVIDRTRTGLDCGHSAAPRLFGLDHRMERAARVELALPGWKPGASAARPCPRTFLGEGVAPSSWDPKGRAPPLAEPGRWWDRKESNLRRRHVMTAASRLPTAPGGAGENRTPASALRRPHPPARRLPRMEIAARAVHARPTRESVVPCGGGWWSWRRWCPARESNSASRA